MGPMSFIGFTLIVMIVSMSGDVLGQNSFDNCLTLTGTCRLGGCYSNETSLPGEAYCNGVSTYWVLLYCVQQIGCCPSGSVCRSQCQSGETTIAGTTQCVGRGGRCCVVNGNQIIRPRTSVASRQGVCGSLIPSTWTRPPAPRIVGGAAASRQLAPWMVHFIVTNRVGSTRSREVLCTGVLVGSDTVLTVAHCFSGLTTLDLQVVLADYDLAQTETGEETIPVRSLELNPDFRLGIRGNDLAVAKLSRPVTFTSIKYPACLPDPDIPILGMAINGNGVSSGSRCYLTGWGRTERQTTNSQLRSARVSVLENNVCNTLMATTTGDYTSSLPTDMICTDTISTGADACLFDDGAALMCQDSLNRYSLVGLVSEYSCGRLPTLYTQVSNYTEPILARL